MSPLIRLILMDEALRHSPEHLFDLFTLSFGDKPKPFLAAALYHSSISILRKNEFYSKFLLRHTSATPEVVALLHWRADLRPIHTPRKDIACLARRLSYSTEFNNNLSELRQKCLPRLLTVLMVSVEGYAIEIIELLPRGFSYHFADSCFATRATMPPILDAGQARCHLCRLSLFHALYCLFSRALRAMPPPLDKLKYYYWRTRDEFRF